MNPKHLLRLGVPGNVVPAAIAAVQQAIASGMTGDAAGVPLSNAGQWRAQSWSPDDFDTAEWVCRPHVWDYSLEGPLSAMRIWTETDEASQKIIAYRGHINQE